MYTYIFEVVSAIQIFLSNCVCFCSINATYSIHLVLFDSNNIWQGEQIMKLLMVFSPVTASILSPDSLCHMLPDTLILCYPISVRN